jgi:hypothetical protein
MDELNHRHGSRQAVGNIEEIEVDKAMTVFDHIERIAAKPDARAECKAHRDNKTAIELFLAGVRSLESVLQRRLDDATAKKM